MKRTHVAVLLVVLLFLLSAIWGFDATKTSADNDATNTNVPAGSGRDPGAVTTAQGPNAAAASGCGFTANLGSPPAPATTGTMTTRLFRSGVGSQGACSGNTFPGDTGSGSFPFDAYTFTNSAASPVCVTAALTVNSTNVDYQIAAFLAPFAAGDITNSARYLGDPGLSISSVSPLTFQFTVPASTSFAIIVYSVNGTAELGGSYTFELLSPSFCAQAPPPLPALYGGSADGDLFAINLNTGNGKLIGILPFGNSGSCTEIAFNNATRRAFTEFSPASGFIGGEEFDVNTAAGIGSPVATDAGGAFNGLEWVGSTLYGTMITAHGGASQLLTLDPFSGTTTLIGSTGMGPIAGLAYDQTTGIMYGITGGNGTQTGGSGNLVTLNLATGTATTIGPVGFAAGSLKFGPDGNLYAGSTGSNPGNLYRINKATGAGTLVGYTGFSAGVNGLMLVNPPPNTVQFSAAGYSANEGDGSATITVTRAGDTSGPATVDFATSDGTASQRTKYTIATGTLSFNPGETSKTFQVLIVDGLYVDGNQFLNLTLSNPTGCTLGTPSASILTIVDNDTLPPTTNPLDNADAKFFVTQHYYDFLSRVPDASGFAFWTGQITQCGSSQTCLRTQRLNVSNAFFFELEYQQTAAYVFRLYRAAYGNSQPFPNPDSSNATEANKLPSYAVFSRDRARLIGSANLAQDQLALANLFTSRPEFLNKYPSNLTGAQFVAAVLANIQAADGVDLTSQQNALVAQYHQGGPGMVMFSLADDDAVNNTINNRAFIDAEYNRAFVAAEYFGYLRRDADIGGFLFWIGQVNSCPIRNVGAQHAMVCSFLTSQEYQQRFSSVVTHTNGECAAGVVCSP
jgi:hypothetical protein